MMNVYLFLLFCFVVNLLLSFDTAFCLKRDDVNGWQHTVEVTKSDRFVVTATKPHESTLSKGYASVNMDESEETPTLEWVVIPLGSFGLKFASDKNSEPTFEEITTVLMDCHSYLMDAIVQFLNNDGNPETPILDSWGAAYSGTGYYLANATDQYTLFIEYNSADLQLDWPREYVPSYNDLFAVMLSSITPEFILDTVRPAAPGSPFEYATEALLYPIEEPDPLSPTASPIIFFDTPEPTGVITDKPVKSRRPRTRTRNNQK